MIKKIVLFLLLFSVLSIWFTTNWIAADITSPGFMINVWDIAPGWSELDGGSAVGTWEKVLQTIITKLMIAFWVLALLVMTIGWGYMIFYHGQDDLLSKWKTIFSAWLIALAVALSAWILVKVVAYILY